MTNKSIEIAKKKYDFEKEKLDSIHKKQRDLEIERSAQFEIYIESMCELHRVNIEFIGQEHKKFMIEVDEFIKEGGHKDVIQQR